MSIVKSPRSHGSSGIWPFLEIVVHGTNPQNVKSNASEQGFWIAVLNNCIDTNIQSEINFVTCALSWWKLYVERSILYIYSWYTNQDFSKILLSKWKENKIRKILLFYVVLTIKHGINKFQIWHLFSIMAVNFSQMNQRNIFFICW